MANDYQAFFAGELQDAQSGEWIEATNPATGELLGQFPRCTAADVDVAVEAALTAFPTWRDMFPTERAKCLLELADRIEADRERLTLLDVRDNGSPISEMAIDIDVGAKYLRYYAGLALQVRGETMPTGTNRLNYTMHQPFGVTALIIPFNHPLMLALKTIGAPLVVGNTVIIKPSEHTSLSALAIIEHIKAVFPPGVVSIVTGYGYEAGDALAVHPDVRRIHFIGGDKTGRTIQSRAASTTVKSITLELGGKNPIVIWPDADIDAALDGVVNGMRFNFQGQACGSTSRLLLPASIKEEFTNRLAERLDNLKVGFPENPETNVGAIVNEGQFNRVLEYIALGLSEGATLRSGGKRLVHDELDKGLFILPTLFTDVAADSRLATEEIFGPILAAIEYQDYEDVINIVNSVHYGLTASIFTKDLAIAHKFARDVEAGYIWINDNQRHFIGTPYGGNKNSGLGREEDPNELLSYTEVKNVNLLID